MRTLFTTIICIGIATVLVWALARANSRKRNHAARMRELRFPTLEKDCECLLYQVVRRSAGDGTRLSDLGLARRFRSPPPPPPTRRTTLAHERGTPATLLKRAGVDIHIIQRILRHADIKLTADTYGHVNAEDLREAVNKIAPGPQIGAKTISTGANRVQMGGKV